MQDRTTTGTKGDDDTHSTRPLHYEELLVEEGWCIRVMTGRGGPTTRLNDDSTPHHGCEQLLAGWI
jgi:hypothetical protein